MSYLEDANYALRTDKEKAAEAETKPKAVPPLAIRHIVWGVFLGMWMFALTAGLAYEIVNAAH